jgi:hypothetical protein
LANFFSFFSPFKHFFLLLRDQKNSRRTRKKKKKVINHRQQQPSLDNYNTKTKYKIVKKKEKANTPPPETESLLLSLCSFFSRIARTNKSVILSLLQDCRNNKKQNILLLKIKF